MRSVGKPSAKFSERSLHRFAKRSPAKTLCGQGPKKYLVTTRIPGRTTCGRCRLIEDYKRGTERYYEEV